MYYFVTINNYLLNLLNYLNNLLNSVICQNQLRQIRDVEAAIYQINSVIYYDTNLQ